MSNLVVSTEAEKNTLNLLIAQMLSVGQMHLLGSAVTVDPTTTLAACLAAEASFTGYAPATLTTWSAPVIDSAGASSSTSSSGTFNNTGGSAVPVFGMFLTDYPVAHLWGAEAFASPVSIPPGLGFNNVLTYTLLSRY